MEVTEEEFSLAATRLEQNSDLRNTINAFVREIKRKHKISVRDYLGLTEKCEICGWDEIVQIHHIIPRNQGGPDTLENYMGLCPNCHDAHHFKRRTIEYLREKYGGTFNLEKTRE